MSTGGIDWPKGKETINATCPTRCKLTSLYIIWKLAMISLVSMRCAVCVLASDRSQTHLTSETQVAPKQLLEMLSCWCHSTIDIDLLSNGLFPICPTNDQNKEAVDDWYGRNIRRYYDGFIRENQAEPVGWGLEGSGSKDKETRRHGPEVLLPSWT
jgi:hypothetical protein